MRKKFTKICQCGCKKKFKTIYEKTRFIKGHYRKFQVGNKAPTWNGGVIIKRGYVLIYSPQHPAVKNMPRFPYVKRSRLTMEKKLGRFLDSWEFVHHINGIKDDDRIENLMLTTLSKHNHIHISLKNRKRDKGGRLL